jgi:GPI mannosyltransferase 3
VPTQRHRDTAPARPEPATRPRPRAPELAAALMGESRVALGVLGAALSVGGAIRVWLSLNDDGIYWPDEIFQSLEPAHRLVFGYGLVAWEFLDGARNWAFPGFVALLLAIERVIGLSDPRAYIDANRLVFSGVGIATAFGSYRLARAYGAASLAAACGAALVALAAPMIYFAPRALSETASALPIVFGFSFALWPGAGRSQRALGASLLGLAVLLRLQNAIFCVGLLAILAGRRQWRSAIEASVVLAGWAILYGLVDLMTWGGWFHSVVTYLSAALSPEWYQWWATHPVGIEPPDYFVRLLWNAMPAAALLAAGLALAAVRRAPGLLAVALAFLVFHSAFPHKELRYIVPVLPLFGALAAIGLDALGAAARRLGEERAADLAWVTPTLSIAVLASAAFSAAGFHDLTLGQVGQSGPRNPVSSAYDDPGSLNRLLFAAGKQPDLCGLKIETSHLDMTGGYSYLHRPVPLYPIDGPARESGYFNYAIVFRTPELSGDVRASDGPVALVRLRATCVRDDGYSWSLR